MATSNACYFEWLEWQADRGAVKQQISIDDDRPDITGLYGGVLATFWCNDFDRLLERLGEMKNERIQQAANGGERLLAEEAAAHP